MDAIHRYEGKVNQFIGDGVMAIFGAPITHEDHAQYAFDTLYFQYVSDRYFYERGKLI